MYVTNFPCLILFLFSKQLASLKLDKLARCGAQTLFQRGSVSGGRTKPRNGIASHPMFLCCRIYAYLSKSPIESDAMLDDANPTARCRCQICRWAKFMLCLCVCVLDVRLRTVVVVALSRSKVDAGRSLGGADSQSSPLCLE
jgi:hypothetical protein